MSTAMEALTAALEAARLTSGETAAFLKESEFTSVDQFLYIDFALVEEELRAIGVKRLRANAAVAYLLRNHGSSCAAHMDAEGRAQAADAAGNTTSDGAAGDASGEESEGLDAREYADLIALMCAGESSGDGQRSAQAPSTPADLLRQDDFVPPAPPIDFDRLSPSANVAFVPLPLQAAASTRSRFLQRSPLDPANCDTGKDTIRALLQDSKLILESATTRSGASCSCAVAWMNAVAKAAGTTMLKQLANAIFNNLHKTGNETHAVDHVYRFLPGFEPEMLSGKPGKNGSYTKLGQLPDGAAKYLDAFNVAMGSIHLTIVAVNGSEVSLAEVIHHGLEEANWYAAVASGAGLQTLHTMMTAIATTAHEACIGEVGSAAAAGGITIATVRRRVQDSISCQRLGQQSIKQQIEELLLARKTAWKEALFACFAESPPIDFDCLPPPVSANVASVPLLLRCADAPEAPPAAEAAASSYEGRRGVDEARDGADSIVRDNGHSRDKSLFIFDDGASDDTAEVSSADAWSTEALLRMAHSSVTLTPADAAEQTLAVTDSLGRMVHCRDCGADFLFAKGEEEFFRRKGWTSVPVRCKECRAAKKARVEAAKDGTSRHDDGACCGEGRSAEEAEDVVAAAAAAAAETVGAAADAPRVVLRFACSGWALVHHDGAARYVCDALGESRHRLPFVALTEYAVFVVVASMLEERGAVDEASSVAQNGVQGSLFNLRFATRLSAAMLTKFKRVHKSLVGFVLSANAWAYFGLTEPTRARADPRVWLTEAGRQLLHQRPSGAVPPAPMACDATLAQQKGLYRVQDSLHERLLIGSSADVYGRAKSAATSSSARTSVRARAHVAFVQGVSPCATQGEEAALSAELIAAFPMCTNAKVVPQKTFAFLTFATQDALDFAVGLSGIKMRTQRLTVRPSTSMKSSPRQSRAALRNIQQMF
jgi:hypothetical protein